jgi:hypothetical protein
MLHGYSVSPHTSCGTLLGTWVTSTLSLIGGANKVQQRAAIRYVFHTVWIEAHRIKAFTPTDLYTPMLAAVESMRGVDGEMGVPEGFRTRNLLSHSQAQHHPQKYFLAFYCYPLVHICHSHPRASIRLAT